MARKNKFSGNRAKKTKAGKSTVISETKSLMETNAAQKLERTIEESVTQSREIDQEKESTRKKLTSYVKGYIAIVILIGAILVGFFGLFTNLPQIAISDLQVFSEDIIKQLVLFFNGDSASQIDGKKITDIANKLQVMGYDFESYGFGLIDKYEDVSILTNGNSTIERGKSKQIRSIYNVGRQYLTAYVAANTSTYLKAGYNYKNFFAGDENIYSTGLIQNDTALQDLSVYFTINQKTRRLQPYSGNFMFSEWQPLTSFDLKSWAAEYGRPLELFFALHTATMMPDLTYHLATDSVFNTRVHVYAQQVDLKYKAKYEVVSGTLTKEVKERVDQQMEEFGNDMTTFFPYIGYVSNHWFYNTIDFTGGATGLQSGSYKRDGTLKSLGYKTEDLTILKKYDDTEIKYSFDITSYSPNGKLLRQVSEPQLDMTKPNQYIKALFTGGEGQVSNKYENGQKYSYSGKYYKYDGSMETARKIAIAKAIDAIIDKEIAKDKGGEYLVSDAYVKDESKKVTYDEASNKIKDLKIVYKWHSEEGVQSLADIVVESEEKEEYLKAKVYDGSLVPTTDEQRKYLNNKSISEGPMCRKEATLESGTTETTIFNGKNLITYDAIMILGSTKTLEAEYALRSIKYLMANLSFSSAQDLSINRQNILLWPVETDTINDPISKGQLDNSTTETDKSTTEYGMTIQNVAEASDIIAPGDGLIVSLASVKENGNTVLLSDIEGFEENNTVVLKLDKLSDATIKALDYKYNGNNDNSSSIDSTLTTNVYMLISNIDVKVTEGTSIKRGELIGYPQSVEKNEIHPTGTDSITIKMLKSDGELIENLNQYITSNYTKSDEEKYIKLSNNEEVGEVITTPLNADDSSTPMLGTTSSISSFTLKQSGDGFTDVTKVPYKDNYLYYKNYKQFKGTYKDNRYSEGTIHSAGCGPASIAIILSGYGIEATPGDTAKKMGGAHNGGTDGPKLASCLGQYGLKAKVVYFGDNVSDIKQILIKQLKTGRPVSLSVHNNSLNLTPRGHLIAVLAVSDDEKMFLVSNPGSSGAKTGWLDATKIADAATGKYAVLIQTDPKINIA